MTDLSDIINIFGTQNNLSGLQEWAKAGGAAADPDYSHLAQLAPRTYAEMFPQILSRQQQMAGIGLIPDGSQKSSPSALQQYAGDQSPNSPVPQGLPDIPQPPQQPDQQAPSGISQLQQAFKYGGGNVEQGLKIMQAQKALQIPPGTGPIPQGQQYVNGTLQNIPGAMTPGQVDRDKDFADIYTPFKNTGGQQNAQSQIGGIDDVIKLLSKGQNGEDPKLTTGGPVDAFAFNNEGMPSDVGRIADKPLIYAQNQIAKAVLPSSKALFGARVTQGEVFRNLMANGLNPYASNEENISNLTTLKNNLTTAQNSLSKAGEYFDKNGTLAGYQGSVPGIDANKPATPQTSPNQPNPALIDALKRRGLLK